MNVDVVQLRIKITIDAQILNRHQFCQLFAFDSLICMQNLKELILIDGTRLTDALLVNNDYIKMKDNDEDKNKLRT